MKCLTSSYAIPGEMSHNRKLGLMSVAGCIALLTRQVISEEFSQCYDDVNICLWTDGSLLTRSNAEAACQQRNNSFLPRITDSSIQNKLVVFRDYARSVLGNVAFWIDVHAATITGFHWIDGSPLAGSSCSPHKFNGIR